MHAYTFLAAAALSSGAFAAPASFDARAEAVSMMANVAPWTITTMMRTCNAGDTQCTWSFGVNDGATSVPCTVVINGTPASQTNTAGATMCGPYSVTSGWSGQFGPGNGFTTFAVANYPANLIVYPAYTDKEVAAGTVVTPDKSYAPQSIHA